MKALSRIHSILNSCIRCDLRIFLLIAVLVVENAGAELPDNNLEYPVLIEAEDGGVGSGFFLEAGRKIYLVTAGHVLFSRETQQLKGSLVRVTSHSMIEKSTFGMELELDRLMEDSRIRMHGEHDVLLIHIGEMEGESNSAARESSSFR